MRLLLVALAVPIIEIALFVEIGGRLTLWPTLAIVVGTGLLGVAVIRREGLRTGAELRAAARGLRDPRRPVAADIGVLAAGLLLILPGFLTDAAGLLLLVPAVRAALMRALARRLAARVVTLHAGARARAHEDVIEAEVIDITPPRRPSGDAARSRH